MTIDKGTTFRWNFQWAKVLVKADSRDVLALLNVVVGLLCYAI